MACRSRPIIGEASFGDFHKLALISLSPKLVKVARVPGPASLVAIEHAAKRATRKMPIRRPARTSADVRVPRVPSERRKIDRVWEMSSRTLEECAQMFCPDGRIKCVMDRCFDFRKANGRGICARAATRLVQLVPA
jgi:hypothetical protein